MTLIVSLDEIVALADDGAQRRPDLARRLQRAVEYIRAGALTENPDGTWFVQSLSRDRVYLVNGHCNCADARAVAISTAAPDGYCKHRLAVGLVRRWRQLEAQRLGAIAAAQDEVTAARQAMREAAIRMNKARAALRAAKRAYEAGSGREPAAGVCRHCGGLMLPCETPGGDDIVECTKCGWMVCAEYAADVAIFEANGRYWQTDGETLALLRQYRDAANAEMLGAVFELGQEMGRISEVAA